MEKFTGKQKWIVIIALTVVLAGLVVASVIKTNSTTLKPADLGPKLEYVGKQTVGGCVLWWCESPPYTEYYFATDMSEDELGGYFAKASLSRRERDLPTRAGW